MAYIEVDELNITEVLAQEFDKKNIVILKFGSTLCDACQALDFELEEIDDKHENISILEIDVSESEELTHSYGVKEIPTMVIYENANNTLWHKSGVMLAPDIEKIIFSI